MAFHGYFSLPEGTYPILPFSWKSPWSIPIRFGSCFQPFRSPDGSVLPSSPRGQEVRDLQHRRGLHTGSRWQKLRLWHRERPWPQKAVVDGSPCFNTCHVLSFKGTDLGWNPRVSCGDSLFIETCWSPWLGRKGPQDSISMNIYSWSMWASLKSS